MEVSETTILVVDDDEDVREALAQGLEARGYQVTTAVHGLDALHRIGEKRPDLILLDIDMPVMGGFELLDRLRRDAGTRNLPVVVLTALNSEEHVVRGVDVGATMYLAKPVSLPRLTALIAALLSRRPPAA